MKNFTFTAPAQHSITTKIVVGVDAVSSFPEILKDLASDRIVILYDVSIHHIARRIAGICKGHDPILIEVASGDATKSLAEVERIAGLMLQARCTRTTTLIAVGGGMVTDLGGFVGSVFMRGVRTILVPTSMLSMVDAAIGGKTAVNIGTTKNSIGTIAQPVAIVCDIDIVNTLPATLFSEGLVEAVKVAAISDMEFFEWLEVHMQKIISRDTGVVTECVARAIDAKLRVVSKDLDDHDLRLHLNFGHTVAHALEAVSSFSLSHGQAVAIGMHFEMRACNTVGMDRVLALLTMLEMPIDIPKKWKQKDLLWDAMQNDKKNERGEVRIAVPEHLGGGTVVSLSEKRFVELL